MTAGEIRERLMCYPSVMVMKPEYKGGWVVSGRDMESFFAEIAKLFNEPRWHERRWVPETEAE